MMLNSHANERTTPSGKSNTLFGWQIESIDAPFEFVSVRSSSNDPVTEVASLDNIAERYLEVGGSISSPPLAIPGIGTLMRCENAQGERFCFLEEEEPVRPEWHF